MIRRTKKKDYELLDHEGNVIASSPSLEAINCVRRLLAVEEIRPPLSSRPRPGVSPVSSLPPYGLSKVYKD